MEIHNIVQEAVTKTISNKNKCKKAKQLSEEALQIAEKRREAKCKGEKERYTHLNVKFQRMARKEKKAFQKQQNGKIQRSPQENQRYNTGIFHTKIGKIKDRNGMENGVTEWYNRNRRY